MEESGFVPVTAIFYAVFHPTEGTKVLHQIPSGAIVAPAKPDSSTLPQTLFDFDAIKNYVIPKPQFCNRLITFKTGSYRVIGYPVTIYGSQYARNSFNFNFCFVFPYDGDTNPYEDHIRRIGKMFRTLEEQSNLLSKKIEQDDSSIFFKAEESMKKEPQTVSKNKNYLQEITDVEGVREDPDILDSITPGVKTDTIELTSIESLIQQLFQDLNNYSECQIPIDRANSVDIKLFPIFPPPPDIKPFDVPIQIVKLDSLVDVNWDPTMVKILPYINGVNSVARIAKLADAEYVLAKQCIQHLMHYKCIEILDVFQFSNMYSPTSKIGLFLEDPRIAAACQEYVLHEHALNGVLVVAAPRSKSASHSNDSNSVSSEKLVLKPASSNSKVMIPSKSKLFSLYGSLHHGETLKDWSIANAESLKFIDIRRFISFGELNNLIYRIHAYPVSDGITNRDTMVQAQVESNHSEMFERDNSILGESDDKFESKDDIESKKKLKQDENHLVRCLKRLQHFDAICTELGKSRREVEEMLNKLGDWSIINS